MRPLVNAQTYNEHVLHVFYDFENMQDTKHSDKKNVHVPNLVCLQQFCSKCENISDMELDCVQCGKRKHSFWDDPEGDTLISLCESRPWIEKLIVIAHIAEAFDLHFTLNIAFLLNLEVELNMN